MLAPVFFRISIINGSEHIFPDMANKTIESGKFVQNSQKTHVKFYTGRKLKTVQIILNML